MQTFEQNNAIWKQGIQFFYCSYCSLGQVIDDLKIIIKFVEVNSICLPDSFFITKQACFFYKSYGGNR